MKLFLNRIYLLAFAALVFASCDKTKPYDIDVASPAAHFVGKDVQAYPVTVDPAPSYTLQVGTTDVSSSDRLVTYTVTSPTGAVAGTHYTLSGSSNTVTIPGGKALADIVIQANYAEYSGGRIDTLLFAIQKPSLEPTLFSDTVRIAIKGPTGCDEAAPDFVPTLGAYDNTNELLGTSPYGPYTTTITSITSTGPTTAEMVVENIWDNGWGPITFILDWTDPTNRTVEVVPQAAIPGSDAGDLNPTYAGMPVAVRPYATSGPGTYSACDQDWTLNMQLGVGDGAGGVLGYFNVLYQVHMLR